MVDLVNISKILPLMETAMSGGEWAEGWSEGRYLEALTERVPQATRDDLDAVTTIQEMIATLYAWLAEGHRQIVSLLEPFGLGSDGVTTEEAVAAIPDDWTEQDNFHRLIVTIDDLQNTLNRLWDIGSRASDEYEADALMVLEKPMLLLREEE